MSADSRFRKIISATGGSSSGWPRTIVAEDFLNSAMRGFVGQELQNTVNPQDFVDLAATGANMVRVWLVFTWNGSAYVADPFHLERLDYVISLCRDLKVYILLALGISGPDMPWAIRIRTDAYALVCAEVAFRIAGNRVVAAIDGMNEPTVRDPATAVLQDYVNCIDGWRLLADQCVDAIRLIDPQRVFVYQHAVVADPTMFPGSTAPNSTNLVFSPHFYEPDPFTHQNVGNWVNNVAFAPGVEYDATVKSDMLTSVQIVAEWLNGRPAIAGEFSTANWAPNNGALYWNCDSIEAMEAVGISWLFHAWRSAPMWDPEAVPNGQANYTRSTNAPIISELKRAFSLAPGAYRAPTPP